MLTHSKPIQRDTTKNGNRLMMPAIGLKRPEDSSDAGKFDEKIKCRTNPTNASSTTYEIGMACFKDGTPEVVTLQEPTDQVFRQSRRDGRAKQVFFS